VLLAIVRGTIVRLLSKNIMQQPEKCRNLYIGTHITMLIMDIALIAPIAYMVIGKLRYDFGMGPAIVMAAYTMYRLTMGIIHMVKCKKEENLLIKELRTINLQDALVALLTLQNALIIANGTEMTSMMGLTEWTSFGIWATILFFTIKSFTKVRNFK